MSTTTAPPPAATTPVRTPDAPAAVRLTPLRVVRSEWVKFHSLRSTVTTLVVSALLVLGFALLAAALTSGAISGGDVEDGQGPPADIALSGIDLVQIGFGLLGVLVVTNEYATGMIRATLAAVPKRLPVLWAKVAVSGLAVLAVAVPAVLLSFLGSQAILDAGGEPSAGLGDDGVLRAMAAGSLYLVAVTLVGVAVGALLRSTAGAISTLFAGLLVLPSLMGLLPSSWEEAVTPYLLSSAGDAFSSTVANPDLLSAGAGGAVLLGWVVALLGAAAWRLRRVDA